MSEQEKIRFIQNNLQMTNREIAAKLQIEYAEVRKLQKRYKIFRTEEQRQQVISRFNQERVGEKNPNWKDGISFNNYHYKKLQVERYPERVNARRKVHRAVKSGKLLKQPCVVCGSKNVQAHHEDYSKPLDVIWLCPKHHRETDKIKKAI